jgi:C-terminal processing protease CtpA/Prc
MGMKNKYIYIISFIFCLLIISTQFSFSQVPDNINGRLWRLCKVWGFAKYYHENNCTVNWNSVLLKAIDSTLVSTSNASFNAAIMELLAAAGPIPHDTSHLIVYADTNFYAHFDWINDNQFNQEVRNTLDSIVVNFRPKENCFVKYNDHSDPNFNGFLDFREDYLNIPSFSYSKESCRLLTFFYYWNIINYFHADRDLMDQDWDSTLYQFIPLFQKIQTDVDFHVLLYHLATFMNDSHGFTYSQLIYDYFGLYFPYLKVRYIENQTVVTKVGAGITDISPGDIIKKIDGIDIAYYRDSLYDYALGSNESSRQLDLHNFFLRGPINSSIDLELENSAGATFASSVIRNAYSNNYFTWSYTDTNAVWKITTCGYGYVDMGKFTTNQIPSMYAALKNTPAIIFDLRNYPNGTLWGLIPYFYSSPQTWALLTDPDLTFPGWYYWYDNQYDAGTFSNMNPYKGKVIILCNAETLSQAEYTVMGLQQHTNSFTIGSQTSGADGNISYIELPGGLTTVWTSLGIYYPDTTTAQRVGVRIDSVVIPTIEDIRLGRDIELMTAFDCLTNTVNVTDENPAFSIYPNPADNIFYLKWTANVSRDINIAAFNTIGQQIFHRTIHGSGISQIPINVSSWTQGFYYITLGNEKGIVGSEKIQIQH